MKKIKTIPDLKDYQTRFIVHQFACFVSPEELTNNLKRIYEIDVHMDLLLTINPGMPELCVLEDQWHDHFVSIREKFFCSVLQIPVANVYDRLRHLQAMFEKADSNGDVELILKIFEAARLDTTPAFEEMIRLERIEKGIDQNRKPFKA